MDNPPGATTELIGGMVEAYSSKERLVPQRVFARPFRLTFEKQSGETTMIEVKTLDGLREVISRRNEGKVFEIDGYTLEIQLWGVLAEHCGFLRADPGSKSALSSGVQPISEAAAALTSDLAELCGGDDAGIQMLEEMRRAVGRAENAVRERHDHAFKLGKFVKEDGVNLTPAGEEKLAEIVGEPLTEIERAAAHAEAILAITEPEELTADTLGPSEGETITGEEAADAGRRVEEAGMGELREEQDEPDSE
jgi:hypothetical protein